MVREREQHREGRETEEQVRKREREELKAVLRWKEETDQTGSEMNRKKRLS